MSKRNQFISVAELSDGGWIAIAFQSVNMFSASHMI